MGRCAHRPCRPCHPERRARGARSRRTSRDAEACGGAEAPWPVCARVFSPAALARPESASDPRKSGSQGSMGRYAHRPSCPWFVHLRVRLTKPPQIAGLAGWSSAALAAGTRAAVALDLRRLVQVSCGWPRVAAVFDLHAHRTTISHNETSPRLRSAPTRVGEIAFRAHFLRFVARAHPHFALSGRFMSASNGDLSDSRCSDLRFCRAPTPTDAFLAPPGSPSLQRTSKNVHEPGSCRRGCNESQKMCSRLPVRCVRIRALRAAAGDGCPSGAGGGRAQPAGITFIKWCKRRAPADRGRCAGRTSAKTRFVYIFFRFVARLRGGSASSRAVRGNSCAVLSISQFVIVRLTCGFPRGGRRLGALGPSASATNRKKCARSGAFADKRATNRKKCAAEGPRRRLAPRAGLWPGGARPRAAARPPATCGRPQVKWSRSPRPAARNLHQSPQVGGGCSTSARRGRGAVSSCATRRFVEVS